MAPEGSYSNHPFSGTQIYPKDFPNFHPTTSPPLPSAVRFLRNAFSASPAVQIRPGPLGSLAELRKYRRKSPDFFLKTWQCKAQVDHKSQKLLKSPEFRKSV